MRKSAATFSTSADAQAAPFIQHEYDMWTKVIKDTGIKLD